MHGPTNVKITTAYFLLYCMPVIQGQSAAHDSTHIIGLDIYVIQTA